MLLNNKHINYKIKYIYHFSMGKGQIFATGVLKIPRNVFAQIVPSLHGNNSTILPRGKLKITTLSFLIITKLFI